MCVRERKKSEGEKEEKEDREKEEKEDREREERGREGERLKIHKTHSGSG